ncbi:hypothetical protein Vafri_281 [Volvox africanus]|nr:hypothetical protein Vafri_281 [Volvox africanus]
MLLCCSKNLVSGAGACYMIDTRVFRMNAFSGVVASAYLASRPSHHSRGVLIAVWCHSCLKRMMKGDQVLDVGSSTLRMLHNEYTAVVESLAGMGAGTGPGTNCAPATTAPAASAAAIAPSAAAATVTNAAQLGAIQAIRESPNNLGLPPPPPPRMLGSPRIFSREFGAASLAAPQMAPAVCGDGNDVYGEAALVAAVAVAAAAGGSCSTQHMHSSSQLDLPVPYQSCAEAAALLLSSSPQHPHQQLHSVLLQAHANRRSSCGAPVDLPSPSPPSPPSGPLLVTAALAHSLTCPISPKLRPGSSIAAREAGTSPGFGSSSSQLPTLLVGTVSIAKAVSDGLTGSCSVQSQQLLGSEGLDSVTGAGERHMYASIPPQSATSFARNEAPYAFAVVGDSGRGDNGGCAGPGVPASCNGSSGPYLLPQQPPLRGTAAAPGGIIQCSLVSGKSEADLPLLPLPQHANSDQHGRVLESADCAFSDKGAAGAAPLEQPQQRRMRRQSQGGQWQHLIEEPTRHDSNSFGLGDRPLLFGDALLILPGSSVCSAQELAGTETAISVACASSLQGTAVHPGVDSDNGGQAPTAAESAVAARSLPFGSGPLGISIGEFGGVGDNDDKAMAASLPLAVPCRMVAPCQALSPEQQQHVEAVLPVCMERLGAGSMRPQPLLATGSPVAEGGADALVGHWLSQSMRIEEGRETAEVDSFCETEGHARSGADAAGHGSASRAAAAVISAANGCADRAASAAFAAAKDAYTRFGDSCPEEVLRVVMESAILDEQMDGVTEQQRSLQQQHAGSPATQLSSVGAGVALRQCCEDGQEGLFQGAPSHSRRPGEQEQQQKQHVIQPPAEASDSVGMHAVASSYVEASGFPSAAGAVGESGGAVAARRGGFDAAAMSAFAGANAWPAATAALGAPVYLRTSSRCLGEESSSPSRCGYSSDEAGVIDGDASCDGGGDGDGVNGNTSFTAGNGLGPGGGSAVRRRRRTLPVGSPGAQGPGDSDDQDGDGYDVYGGVYGGASPLQEYGSVYESATHDDMDEHGDDDEGVPLGRSNTIIRHLAGALVRSRMRASASAAVSGGAAAATSWPSPHAAAVHTQLNHNSTGGPPPAASTGAAQRVGVNRKVSPGVAGVGSSPRHFMRHQQQLHDYQHNTANPNGLSNLRPDSVGGGEYVKQGIIPSSVAAGVDQQLRQLLRGGAASRIRSTGDCIVGSHQVASLAKGNEMLTER